MAGRSGMNFARRFSQWSRAASSSMLNQSNQHNKKWTSSIGVTAAALCLTSSVAFADDGNTPSSSFFNLRKWTHPKQSVLLPPPVPDPLGNVQRTVVLEINDLLIHEQWTREHGSRVRVRPGAQLLLQECFQNGFEVVLFTTKANMMDRTVEIERALDPRGYIQHRLYRDATCYVQWDIVKDLSMLNRDLSRVVILDNTPSSFKLQPENAVLISKWRAGKPDDRELFKAINFIRMIAQKDVSDVRDMIRSYGGSEEVLSNFDHQRQQSQQQKQHQSKESSAPESSAAQKKSGGLASWFGGAKK